MSKGELHGGSLASLSVDEVKSMSGLSLHEKETADLARLAPGAVIGTGGPSDWIVVSCHAHKESVALDNLRRQDFTCYCPVLHRQVRHARRTYRVRAPPLPELCLRGDRFRSPELARTPLHARCPSASSVAAKRRAHSRTSSSKACASVRWTGPYRPSTPYSVGQRVRLNKAAFDGLVATIIDIAEKDRVVVLLDLLSRPVRVNVESTHQRKSEWTCGSRGHLTSRP